MPPDFNQKTVDTLAKRAAFLCSNPECRVATVGPNSDKTKATTIGEAAHIFGARPNSARFDSSMTDTARAEITNGIWLCRNCHKIIDRDSKNYSADILFFWREQHEEYVASELGTSTQKKRFEEDSKELIPFAGYPAIIKRIVTDKPRGWEWRLTAEIMRYLNGPVLRQLQDLRDNLYTKDFQRLYDDEVLEWADDRLHEALAISQPFVQLFARLSNSWGDPGVSGNVNEIHHNCRLLHENLLEIVRYEESVRFIRVSHEFEKLVYLLRGKFTGFLDQIADLPDSLDKMVELAKQEEASNEGREKVITKTITLSPPEGWEKEWSRELKNVTRYLKSGKYQNESGCSSFFWIFIAGFLLYVLFGL